MPNHIHALIWLNSGPKARSQKSLGSIIGAFKTVSTKRLREALGEQAPNPAWQRGYFEHIVRKEESLYKIRQYIIDNPLQWDLDSENPMLTSRQSAPAVHLAWYP